MTTWLDTSVDVRDDDPAQPTVELWDGRADDGPAEPQVDDLWDRLGDFA
jgi:hypothetical protein